MLRLRLFTILTFAVSLIAMIAIPSFASDTGLAEQAKQALAEGRQPTLEQKLAYDAIYSRPAVAQAEPRRDERGGPDEFGYRWRDNEDGARYEWIDITQGAMEGEVVANVGDDDNHGPYEMGWDFNFYGRDFNTFRVCSNGWISFTSQATFYNVAGENADFPHGGGYPENVIAPFMADLINGGGTPVRYYTNAEDRILIVAWDGILCYGNRNVSYSFEIILTGNGKIKFQYQTDEPMDQNHQVLCGIQNADRDIGLTVFRAAGGGPPQDEYAVEISKASGWVAGTVTDLETEAPLEGVLVQLSDGTTARTDADGNYIISDVLEDPYTATASVRGYNSVTSDEFEVADQDTVIVSFELPHPEISLDVEAIGAQLPQHGEQNESFNIINDGNGPLDYDMRFTIGGQRDDVGDVLFDWDVTGATNDQRIRGVTILGEEIFLTGSNSAAEPNYVYVLNMDGKFERRFEQPVQNNSAIGMKGIGTDGTYLYSADAREIIKFTTEGEAVGVIQGPLNPSRYVAYDPATDHFWVCDVTSQLFEIDRDGNIIRRVAKPVRAYGISWQPDDLDSCYIYIFHRVPDSSQLAVSKVNPVDGRMIRVTDLQIRDGDVANGCIITNAFNPLVWLMLSLVENNVPDRLVGIELSLNTSWVHVNPMRGSVEPDGSSEIAVEFDAGSWMPGQYELLLAIESNAMTNRIDLPVSMVVTDEGLNPEHFSFQQTAVVHTFTVTAVQLRGERAVWGDEVGVFTPEGLCVGASLWFNQLTRIEAYADDPATDAIDGFRAGEQYSFRVWDRSLDREFAANYNLALGDDAFRDGGASRLSLVVPGLRRDNSWSLPFGWSLISANVTPDDPTLVRIFADPIASGAMVLAKNGAGRFFYPRDGFNNIGDWQGTQGYWVKNLTSVNFATSGDALLADTQIDLTAGWNLIAYIPTAPMDASAAFAPLGDNLVIVKDGVGRFYLPEHNFSNIGSATPGNGYAVMVHQSTGFSYPANGRNAAMIEPRMVTHISAPVSTGSSMSVLVTGDQIKVGSEIVALTVDGSVVGAGAAMENGRLGLAIWGDDPISNERDGMVEGESFSFSMWDGSGDWIPVQASVKSGEMTYTANAIVLADLAITSLPTELVLEGAYPNPFNGLAVVKFSMPIAGSVSLTLHDLMGREVSTLFLGDLPAGAQAVVLNAEDLASGTYLLKLQTNYGSRMAKVLLIR